MRDAAFIVVAAVAMLLASIDTEPYVLVFLIGVLLGLTETTT